MKSWALAAARGLGDLRVGGVEPAVADVVADRAAEQGRLLRHEADPLAEAGRR